MVKVLKREHKMGLLMFKARLLQGKEPLLFRRRRKRGWGRKTSRRRKKREKGEQERSHLMDTPFSL